MIHEDLFDEYCDIILKPPTSNSINSTISNIDPIQREVSLASLSSELPSPATLTTSRRDLSEGVMVCVTYKRVLVVFTWVYLHLTIYILLYYDMFQHHRLVLHCVRLLGHSQHWSLAYRALQKCDSVRCELDPIILARIETEAMEHAQLERNKVYT